MYSNLPNLVLGFHGCDLDTYKNVLYKHNKLRASHNSYDWLGSGIYFWENSLDRAEEWAASYCSRYNKKHPDEKPKEPAAIGAVISLGHCLDLADYGSASILKTGAIFTYDMAFLQDFPGFPDRFIVLKICCWISGKILL